MLMYLNSHKKKTQILINPINLSFTSARRSNIPTTKRWRANHSLVNSTNWSTLNRKVREAYNRRPMIPRAPPARWPRTMMSPKVITSRHKPTVMTQTMAARVSSTRIAQRPAKPVLLLCPAVLPAIRVSAKSKRMAAKCWCQSPYSNTPPVPSNHWPISRRWMLCGVRAPAGVVFDPAICNRFEPKFKSFILFWNWKLIKVFHF